MSATRESADPRPWAETRHFIDPNTNSDNESIHSESSTSTTTSSIFSRPSTPTQPPSGPSLPTEPGEPAQDGTTNDDDEADEDLDTRIALDLVEARLRAIRRQRAALEREMLELQEYAARKEAEIAEGEAMMAELAEEYGRDVVEFAARMLAWAEQGGEGGKEDDGDDEDAA